MLAVLGYQFQLRDEKRAKEQERLEKERLKEYLAEEAIKAYLDSMEKLLLDEELRKKLFPNVNDKFKLLDKNNSVRDVARTQTITILRRLEGDKRRQSRIRHFLIDTELYEFILKNASLSRINFQSGNLKSANLKNADLWGADLKGASLERANLEGVYLEGANLEGADLSFANLKSANLEGANLSFANLKSASLERANLEGVYLEGANLEGADLSFANLKSANLEGANLSFANLKSAKLLGANLTNAFMYRTKNLAPQQVKSAYFWEEAHFTGVEEDEQKYIADLKKDKLSDLEEPVDCKGWEKYWSSDINGQTSAR